MIVSFLKKHLKRFGDFLQENGWRKTAGFVAFMSRTGILIFLLIFVSISALEMFLGLWDHYHPDARINGLASVAQSILSGVNDANRKIDSINSKLDNIESTVNCQEISEHLWDVKDVLVFNDSVVQIQGENGLIRFKQPIKDIFIFDFIFKPSDGDSLDATVALKDTQGSEISLAIGAKDSRTLNWSYKNKGVLIEEEKQTLQGSIKPDTDVKLRIETVEKPDYLTTSAFLIYTPKGKDFQAPPSYLKDFTISRFQDKEAFLHIGFKTNSEQPNPPILKITECKFQEKEGLQKLAEL